MCWRNISYVPGGAQLICTTNVTIPPNVYPSSAEWTLEVDAVNAPVNSACEWILHTTIIPQKLILTSNVPITREVDWLGRSYSRCQHWICSNYHHCAQRCTYERDSVISFSLTDTHVTQTEGCHFTGLPSTGYTFSVVLQWFGQGNPPGAGMNFSFLLFTTTPPTG